jgi:predicted permease
VILILFTKIFGVFSISALGYAANKLKWLPAESTKYLSTLLMNISFPCFVLYTMSKQELSGETIASALQSFGLMLLALAIVSLLSVALVRLMKAPAADRGVYRVLLTLTNNGFMGYPLSYAVFGSDGLFLMIIANFSFTFYTYSVGIVLLVAGKDEKLSWRTAAKAMLSIPSVSCLAGLLIFGLRIQLPELLLEFLDSVGAIMVPLSMIFIGIQLAESKGREILKNQYILKPPCSGWFSCRRVCSGCFFGCPWSRWRSASSYSAWPCPRRLWCRSLRSCTAATQSLRRKAFSSRRCYP